MNKKMASAGTVQAEKPTSPGTKTPVQTHQKPKCRDVRAKEKLQKSRCREAPVRGGILERRESLISHLPETVGGTGRKAGLERTGGQSPPLFSVLTADAGHSSACTACQPFLARGGAPSPPRFFSPELKFPQLENLRNSKDT